MLQLAQILPYLGTKQKKHDFFDKALDIKKALADTFGEKMPRYLIKGVDSKGKEIFKPLEQEKHVAYKESVYRNPFRSFPSRVIEQLDSIQQADDFNVIFPTQERLPNELLQSYLEQDFPGGMPYRQWFFTRGLNLYVNDPNGKLVVIPEVQPVSDRELPQPRIFDVPSDRVIECNATLSVFLSARKSVVETTRGKKKDGKIYWFFDADSYTIATEVKRFGGSKGTSLFEIVGLQTLVDVESNQTFVDFQPPLHNCGRLPVVHIGNAKHLIEENADGGKLFKSVISDAIEPVRDAQELYVMSRVEFYQHLYSKYWQYVTTPCPLIANQKCSNGLLATDYEFNSFKYPRNSICPVCGGSGFVTPKSGLEAISITLPKSGPTSGGPLPAPPFGGYIEKNIENLKAMLEEFRNLEERAWDTINMRFMSRVPMVESGIAKLVDREPANRWLRSQAGHLVNSVMILSNEMIARQRYFVAIGEESIKAILPKISVPKHFDIYDPSFLIDEIKELRAMGADPAVIAEKVIEYERKRTGRDSPTSKLLRIKRAIMPMFGLSLLDVQSLYAGGIGGSSAISQTDYILYVHFDDFVQRALVELADQFWHLEEIKMRELFTNYAKEYIADLPKAETLYNAALNGKGDSGDPLPVDED